MPDFSAHPSKRRVLEALSRVDLAAIVDAYSLEADKRSKTAILDALDTLRSRSRSAGSRLRLGRARAHESRPPRA
ncbi:MAG: hypothetical protein KTR25_10635 [Myxococcales bacterium]|nr:hypothetical protein [Myxococcales bacterium]